MAIAGCACKPETVIEGLYKAATILEEKRAALYKKEKEAEKK